jgi:hypothetical protein
MKSMLFSKDAAFWSLLVLAGMIGVYIGFMAIQRFEIVVRGLMGFTVIYLIHSLFFPPKDFFKLMPYRVLSLKTAKYMFVCFLICLTVSWSVIYFIDLLYYLAYLL